MDTLSRIPSQLFSNITYIGVFFLGAILVLLGFFKVSVIIAASQLVVFIVYPLGNLTSLITSIFAVRAIIKDLTPILNMEEKSVALTSKKLLKMKKYKFCISYRIQR